MFTPKNAQKTPVFYVEKIKIAQGSTAKGKDMYNRK